jgi:23S rRNA-/tRNA-specific pseudouridylate synthase
MPLNDNFVYAPPQDPLSILFEDDDLIVVDKPAGLLSVMGRLPEHHDSAYLRVLEKFPCKGTPFRYGNLRFTYVCQASRCRSRGK